MYKIIKAKVIHGKSFGKKLGFPTANIVASHSFLKDGVYKINGIIDGKIYKGAGVYFKEKRLFEAHFLGFDKNIYGKNIEIVILYKIRDNKNFKNLEGLQKQIKKDIEYIGKKEDYIMTFGTFDIVHPGHSFYLNRAKKYGDKLITIISRDKNVEKFKKNKALNTEKTRLENIKKLGISDMVVLGDLKDPLFYIKKYKPKVICIGYDQSGFLEELEKYVQKNNLTIKIIRLPAYKQNIFKSSILRKKV